MLIRLFPSDSPNAGLTGMPPHLPVNTVLIGDDNNSACGGERVLNYIEERIFFFFGLLLKLTYHRTELNCYKCKILNAILRATTKKQTGKYKVE